MTAPPFFRDLEAPLREKPVFPVEAPDGDRTRTEIARQVALFSTMRMVAPSVLGFAIPNAGRRSQWEVAQRKREGMKAGALDWVVTWNPGVSGRGVAFAEWKDGVAMPDANQRDRLNMLFRMGHHVGVFRREDSFFAWLASLGAPVRLRGGL